MRMIMHDYADPVCVDILAQLVKAMAHDSRVLIAETLTPAEDEASRLPCGKPRPVCNDYRWEGENWEWIQSIYGVGWNEAYEGLEGSGYARRTCRGMFEQCAWRIGKREATSWEDDADFKSTPKYVTSHRVVSNDIFPSSAGVSARIHFSIDP